MCGIVKSGGNCKLHIYFDPPSPSPQPSPNPRDIPPTFILTEPCVLGSSGWLVVYYSTPGALKVRGLAARKVTTGSPPLMVASCWLHLWRSRKRGERTSTRTHTHTHQLCKESLSLRCWKESRAPIIWLCGAGPSQTAFLLEALSVFSLGRPVLLVTGSPQGAQIPLKRFFTALGLARRGLIRDSSVSQSRWPAPAFPTCRSKSHLINDTNNNNN